MIDPRRAIYALFCIGLLTTIKAAGAQEPVQTIEIHAHRFAFSPPEVTLKKGEPVKFRLTSDDVPHSLSIPALKFNQKMTKGHETEVTLTPGTAGDFHGECGTFCGSGHGAMVFTVHVKE